MILGGEHRRRKKYIIIKDQKMYKIYIRVNRVGDENIKLINTIKLYK